MRRRTSAESEKTSSPATRTVPDVAGKKQERIRIVVLLPAPFGPSRPTISPRPTVKEMPDTAVCPAYRLVRFSTSIIKPSFMYREQSLAEAPGIQPTKFPVNAELIQRCPGAAH